MRLAPLLFASLLLGAAPAPPAIFADPMDRAALWPSTGSDSVRASAVAVPGAEGRAVELRYDYGRVSGYAFMRRSAAIPLPPNFEVRFRMRGSGGRNDLQLKLTRDSNVWWKVWRNLRPSPEWQDVVIPASEFEFAWGPSEDKRLGDADGVEFVVARNRDGGVGSLAIDDLRIVPVAGPRTAADASEADPNDALRSLAKSAPRGAYPRAFIGEQPYWTLAGSDGGKIAALISEDGAIEPARGGYSIEPVVVDGGREFNWASVEIRQSLEDGTLPIPSVQWTAPGFTLQTMALADAGGRALYAHYRLTNTGRQPRKLELRLNIRPWQVNPPAQFLSQRGGISRISAIRQSGSGLTIVQPQPDGDPPIERTLRLQGEPLVRIDRMPAVLGPEMATAQVVYHPIIHPGQSEEISLVAPLTSPFLATTPAPPAPWQVSFAETRDHWRDVLGRVKISVPPAKQAFADTVATAFSQILTSRDGPMLKPGTRSYNRAWIRDGAMMSEALLRMGRADVARSFADGYRSTQFDSGKIPCCVDFRGADPVPENDSQGEYIFLVSQLYRFTGDRAALERDWPSVLAAARYMDKLRLGERTAANLRPGRRMLYGLMPPSISHEGYSAKPQYSLWDDFWALRGYRDAADIAALLGKPEASELAASRDQFDKDLYAAILAARDHWGIAFIPGATSLGDFDATSTTIALDPGGEQSRLDKRMLRETFLRYRREFGQRAAGTRQWTDYTPYETRAIGAFVRLGWRDGIDELINFFLADRRPAAWNQWAEVVGRDPREIRFIGDMPHAWVASDFVRGALDMFAWDRRDDAALMLGGGLGADWLSGRGAAIRILATPYGLLDFSMRGDARRLSAVIGGTARPPGGFVLAWPFDGEPPGAKVDGRPAAWHNRALHIRPTGRSIRIEVGR